MNFFEDQDRARKNTNVLLALYGLAIVATSAAISISLFSVLFVNVLKRTPGLLLSDFYIQYQKPLLLVFGVVMAIIITTSFFKILLMGKASEYIAELSGARKVKKGTKDLKVKQYINIVQEMSIASGSPIPKCYVMEKEDAINAFAAGFDPNDCVIAVTRGALVKLTRDELQGVVAHEFSHIFNGDMKLNVKLMGYLSGLELLFNIGRGILRGGRHSSRNSRRGGGGQLMLFALVLFVVGGIGYLFASLIKSLISKEREYLADASSVQFTRNPDGIGNVLKKIYATKDNGNLYAGGISEMSHFFFMSPMKALFDTHPPLKKRILRVFPTLNWDRFLVTQMPKFRKELFEAEKKVHQERINKNKKPSEVKDTSDTIIEKVGLITPHNLVIASQLIESISNDVQESVESLEGAKLTVLSYFLNIDEESFQSQIEYLDSNQYNIDKLAELAPHVHAQEVKLRLPTIEIALNTLNDLRFEEKKKILKDIKYLIQIDKKITKDEFILFQIIRTYFNEREDFTEKYIGGKDYMNARKVLEKFCENFEEKTTHLKFKDISQALKTLYKARPYDKRALIQKLVEIFSRDNKITHLEYETLRLISMSIGVPLSLSEANS
jgi:Zn-dependent protease with chaperone function